MSGSAEVTGNPLLDEFMNHDGHYVHKWVHYFEFYHRHLQRYRGKAPKMVEIGVQNGGSANLWRKYLGDGAEIVGVDIDPACRALEREGFEIWIGDQEDQNFWKAFRRKHPAVDIILDDGGHTMRQQVQTFKSLFPALNESGTYICEDTHSSYFPTHGGGLGREGTFHELVKKLIDEMHAWYHMPLSKLEKSYIAQNLLSLSVYDSMVVMEKRRKTAPITLAQGREGRVNLPSAMTFLDMRRMFGVSDE